MDAELSRYAPNLPPEQWTQRDQYFLEPFAPGMNGFVSVLSNLPPELVGALCSRASRAKDSLLRVLLNEYIYPILDGEDKKLGAELEETVRFLREHGFKKILNNQRAQSFYAKWLSQYGDDSIAQMTGTHMIFWGISQVAMKYLEDRRIGLEPIEKSTRYVNFSNKVGGHYLYYTPRPALEKLGLLKEYQTAMDHLFDTYAGLLPQLIEWLKKNFNDKESVLEKKAFDTLRGLLPMATLGQVAFRGNAQAFEYALNNMFAHPLGEMRWLATEMKKQLDFEIPSLLLRVQEEKSVQYQKSLALRATRVSQWLTETKKTTKIEPVNKPEVVLVDFDPSAEEKILQAIVFSATHAGHEQIKKMVSSLSSEERTSLLKTYVGDRSARWQKVGRAFENSYLKFEITMNIGAYRDLHRHRMMTQERQRFSTHHGYDLPQELVESKLNTSFEEALKSVIPLFEKIEKADSELAQYVVPLAYRMRFYQWQNFRQLFWETELRTISQGHPDYRFIEQEKYRLAKEKFPALTAAMQVDMHQYSIARRGTEEKIAQKEKDIIERLKQRSN